MICRYITSINETDNVYLLSDNIKLTYCLLNEINKCDNNNSTAFIHDKVVLFTSIGNVLLSQTNNILTKIKNVHIKSIHLETMELFVEMVISVPTLMNSNINEDVKGNYYANVCDVLSFYLNEKKYIWFMFIKMYLRLFDIDINAINGDNVKCVKESVEKMFKSEVKLVTAMEGVLDKVVQLVISSNDYNDVIMGLFILNVFPVKWKEGLSEKVVDGNDVLLNESEFMLMIQCIKDVITANEKRNELLKQLNEETEENFVNGNDNDDVNNKNVAMFDFDKGSIRVDEINDEDDNDEEEEDGDQQYDNYESNSSNVVISSSKQNQDVNVNVSITANKNDNEDTEDGSNEHYINTISKDNEIKVDEINIEIDERKDSNALLNTNINNNTSNSNVTTKERDYLDEDDLSLEDLGVVEVDDEVFDNFDDKNIPVLKKSCVRTKGYAAKLKTNQNSRSLLMSEHVNNNQHMIIPYDDDVDELRDRQIKESKCGDNEEFGDVLDLTSKKSKSHTYINTYRKHTAFEWTKTTNTAITQQQHAIFKY